MTAGVGVGVARGVGQRHLHVLERRLGQGVGHRARDRRHRARQQRQGHGVAASDAHGARRLGVEVAEALRYDAVRAWAGRELDDAVGRAAQRVALARQRDELVRDRLAQAVHDVDAQQPVVGVRAIDVEPGLHVACDHDAGGKVGAHLPHPAVAAREPGIGVGPAELRRMHRVGQVERPHPLGVVREVERAPLDPRVVHDRLRVGGDGVHELRARQVREVEHPQGLPVLLVGDVEPAPARVGPGAMGVEGARIGP